MDKMLPIEISFKLASIEWISLDISIIDPLIVSIVFKKLVKMLLSFVFVFVESVIFCNNIVHWVFIVFASIRGSVLEDAK